MGANNLAANSALSMTIAPLYVMVKIDDEVIAGEHLHNSRFMV